MIEFCPFCKKKLHTEHIFCPNCGEDLRNYKNLSFTNQPIRGTKIAYNKYLYEGMIWSIILTTIVSFYYTFPKFNIDLFLQGIISRPILVIILPLMVVQFLKREKREKSFKALSRTLMIILTVTQAITLVGQKELDKFSNEKTKIKVRQECIESIKKTLSVFDLSHDLIKYRGEKYCDCLLDKFNTVDFNEMADNPRLMGKIVKERYVDEEKICLDESLKGKPDDLALR